MSSLIERLLADGEGPSVEFVSATAAFSHIAASVVAMLNGNGGYVLIGVADNGHPVGLLDAPAIAQNLRAELAEAISPPRLPRCRCR